MSNGTSSAVKLPATQLTLPGGFLIEVVYKTDKQCKYLVKFAADGYWDRGDNGGKLVLNRESPIWEQMRVFGHELVHAANDYALWLDRKAAEVEDEAARTAEEVNDDQT